MAEDDGLSATPVLVVDLDVFGIFLPDRNKWHLESFVSVRDSILVFRS